MMKRFLQNDRGSTLVLTIGLIVLLTGLSMTLIFVNAAGTKQTEHRGASMQAVKQAELGLDHLIENIKIIVDEKVKEATFTSQSGETYVNKKKAIDAILEALNSYKEENTPIKSNEENSKQSYYAWVEIEKNPSNRNADPLLRLKSNGSVDKITKTIETIYEFTVSGEDPVIEPEPTEPEPEPEVPEEEPDLPETPKGSLYALHTMKHPNDSSANGGDITIGGNVHVAGSIRAANMLNIWDHYFYWKNPKNDGLKNYGQASGSIGKASSLFTYSHDFSNLLDLEMFTYDIDGPLVQQKGTPPDIPTSNAGLLGFLLGSSSNVGAWYEDFYRDASFNDLQQKRYNIAPMPSNHAHYTISDLQHATTLDGVSSVDPAKFAITRYSEDEQKKREYRLNLRSFRQAFQKNGPFSRVSVNGDELYFSKENKPVQKKKMDQFVKENKKGATLLQPTNRFTFNGREKNDESAHFSNTIKVDGDVHIKAGNYSFDEGLWVTGDLIIGQDHITWTTSNQMRQHINLGGHIYVEGNVYIQGANLNQANFGLYSEKDIFVHHSHWGNSTPFLFADGNITMHNLETRSTGSQPNNTQQLTGILHANEHVTIFTAKDDLHFHGVISGHRIHLFGTEKGRLFVSSLYDDWDELTPDEFLLASYNDDISRNTKTLDIHLPDSFIQQLRVTNKKRVPKRVNETTSEKSSKQKSSSKNKRTLPGVVDSLTIQPKQEDKK